MSKDNKRYTEVHNILIPDIGISMSDNGFDSLIATNGITFVHYKSLLCPIGAKERFDIRADHLSCRCEGGFLYEYAGEFTGFMSGNATQTAFENAGLVDGSTVQLTLPRTYDGVDKPIAIQEYDRLFLKDPIGFASHQQRFESHQSGTERLEFPAEYVEYLMDARGESYRQDIDFVLVDGFVKWTTSRRPGYDPILAKGVVCSIRYHYRPHWYVARLLHEIRVIKSVDMITGEVSTSRMPFAVLLQRELVFRNRAKTSGTDNGDHGGPAPQSGGFGPR